MSSNQVQPLPGQSPAQLHASSGSGAGMMPPGGHRRVSFSNDPRLSTSSIDSSHLSDMLQRRSSAGTIDGLDILTGRRESLDSTTAVLDACILDLTRRRMNVANHLGGPSGTPGSHTGHASAPAAHGHSSFMVPPPGDHGHGAPYGSLDGMVGQSMPGNHQAHASIAIRQQQLQKQQFELEQRQKDLERQRQQLMSGIAEKEETNGGNSGGGLGRQQWWVCHVCNSKAFSSRDEAMAHEAVCSVARPAASEIPHHRLSGVGVGSAGPPPQVPPPVHMQGMPPGMGPMAGMPHGMAGVMGAMENVAQHHQMHSGSNGPFAMLPQPIPLSMNSDKDWLTPLHCFVRRHCVQVFCATQQDVATPSKGKRKPIQVGQVGIRCPHCHSQPGGTRERGSVYYPTTISSIYNATMNLLQRHLHSCSAVPEEIMKRYQTLKADDARSGTSKKYWVESALSLGLVDTPQGIRFSALMPPPLPRLSRQQHSTGVFSAKRRNSNDFFSTKSNAVTDGARNGDGTDADDQSGDVDGERANSQTKNLAQSAPLVSLEDKPYATEFSYHLLSQMQPCVFTEADRLGKRKGLPPGFAGLACRHCFGGYGSGRFFPSSIKTLSDTSKTLNVLHNHMMRCRKCPQEVKDTLEKLRAHHDDERAKMKFGSQKAFFAKIWRRLHEDGTNPTSPLKRRAPQAPPQVQYGTFMHPPPMNQQQKSMADWGAAAPYHGAPDPKRMRTHQM
mmetsp:Transcript_26031/g.36487  ORF Transcript_26031/g.36487 Transcript_26031/m.36487 type:complete len:727 (+) Transcript_26031:149-2329(+)